MYTIFLAGIINITLSAIILISDSKNRKNISLSAFFLNLALWDIFLFYKMRYGRDPYLHILYATISLLPITSYYFLDSYIKKTEAFKILKFTLITFSMIFFALSIMKIMISSLYHNMLVLYLLFSFIIMDIFLYVEYRKELNPAVRVRLKYIFVALTLLLMLGSTDFMTLFNFLRPMMLGNLGTIIFVFMMSYIFLQKDILPVNYMLIKSFIYLMVLLISGLVGYFIIYGFGTFSYALYVKMLIAVIVLIFLYKVTDERIYNLSNKLLSIDEYKYQQLINSFDEDNIRGNNFALVLKKVIDGLFEILHLIGAGVIAMYDNRNEILYSQGETNNNYLKNLAFDKNSYGIKHMKKERKELVVYKVRGREIAIYLTYSRGSFNKRQLFFIETLMKQVQNAMDRGDLLKKIDSIEKIAFAGEVASGIAHDIRNPLSSIKGAVQYVEDSIPDEEKEYLDIIYEDINRIEQIIERFQIFAATRDVAKVKTNVYEFIENIKNRFKNKKLNINNRIPDKYFTVDPVLLEEIVYNIIQNAFDSYEGQEGRVDVKIEKKRNSLVISVKDWGKGIDKKIAEKIFDPFFTTRSSGIGLGLSITKKMINTYNGTIRYENNRDGGTIFIINMEHIW